MSENVNQLHNTMFMYLVKNMCVAFIAQMINFKQCDIPDSNRINYDYRQNLPSMTRSH